MNYPYERNLVNHPPTAETQAIMEATRSIIHRLASAIDIACPIGRERSLAFTKLEEMTMWTMASLARADYDEANEQGPVFAEADVLDEVTDEAHKAAGREIADLSGKATGGAFLKRP